MKRLTITNPRYSDVAKRIAIILFSLGIITYIAFQLQNLVSGPDLVITSPQPGAAGVRLVTLSGRAERAESVVINGNTIFLNQDDSFSFPLLLLPGYNIITVQATDRFGTIANHSMVVIGPPVT